MRAFTAAWLLLFAGPAAAQDISATIIEHGIYTAETVRTEKLPNGFSSNIVRNICHVATTEDIPAKLGVQFGYRYRLDGPQENAAVILTRVTRFPAPMKPPGGAAAQSVSEHNIQMRVGTVSYVGFGFDHDWEMMRGRWALELWQGRKMLARQAFDIGDGELPADRPRQRGQTGDNCFELSVSLPGFMRTGGLP